MKFKAFVGKFDRFFCKSNPIWKKWIKVRKVRGVVSLERIKTFYIVDTIAWHQWEYCARIYLEIDGLTASKKENRSVKKWLCFEGKNRWWLLDDQLFFWVQL